MTINPPIRISKFIDPRELHDKAAHTGAECNLFFSTLVRDGLTRPELERLIEQRPQLWGRFSVWLEKLS